MNKTLTAAKSFVVRNKTTILVTTTVVATTAAVMMKAGLNQHNEFLKENGLFEKFYAIGE